MKQLKNVTTSNYKLAKLRNRRNFLILCRKQDVMPSHITNGSRNVENLTTTAIGHTLHQVTTFNKRLRKQILNLEIKVTHDSIKKLEKQLKFTKNLIVNTLPYNIITDFFRKQSINYNKTFYKIQNNNKRKFTNLRHSQKVEITTQDNWIKNLTDIEIPRDISNFLALGPKFSLEPNINNINIPKLLSDVDQVINHIPNELKNITLNITTNVITNFVHNLQHNSKHNDSQYNKCKLFLKNHPELLVIQSDKMNVTTIMKKQQYEDLSLEILQDSDYYTVLPRDPSSTIQNKSNSLISSLEKNNILTKDESKSYRQYNSTVNKFYGLPKVHKPTLTLRPIISGVSSPNRGVAQLVTNILTVSYNQDNNFFIKDSFQFCDFINEFQLPVNYVLVSLDVKALFNNISINLVSKSIEKHWPDIQSHCKLTKNKLIQLIEFLFDSTVFSFSDNIYKQILGMPMGSPVSPILAQYVMDDLIEDCLNKLNFHVPFLKKYVDDLILSIPQNGKDQLMLVFNNYDPTLQFTIEEEDCNNSVPFLDTRLIRRNDNTIITTWYTKPGASNRFIHYKSYHQQKQKINLVTAMKNRVIRTSHTSLASQNLRLLHQRFINCGYPTRLLNKLIFSRPNINNVHTVQTPTPVNENIRTFYFSLPYNEQLSIKFQKIFSKFRDIKLAFRNVLNIRSLFSKLKDKDDKLHSSNVIYSINCKDCNKNYIGQTSRCLKDRITSHKSDIRCNKQTCTLAKHVLDTNHIMDYDNVQILEKENNLHKRLFLEMSHIFKDANTINSRKDIEGLSIMYTYLLQFDPKTSTDGSFDNTL
ncbi:hypothetical protein NQ317_017230 [Molorchus minor]|uniref:Reverse transcriptase domain-containing protein n=1 Tax=Molorchus minor TaxID=1323400 RepID=A0ABQ9JGD0_9CUCU|nr:hypothetical protein NQ317_017230 [Molorchus minor]